MRWIHLYQLGQGETAELRHGTFLEEVHKLFPLSMVERQTTNSLENVFREIRGFGEGLVSITQHPSLIPIYILGNCNTQVHLGLQHEEDIVAAKRALFLDPGDEVFLDRLRVGEGQQVKPAAALHPLRLNLLQPNAGCLHHPFGCGHGRTRPKIHGHRGEKPQDFLHTITAGGDDEG